MIRVLAGWEVSIVVGHTYFVVVDAMKVKGSTGCPVNHNWGATVYFTLVGVLC